MTDQIVVNGAVPAKPEQIYAAWLDSEKHTAMTGGPAQVTPTIGGSFSARNGYIQGTNLELEPGRRIVQAWRTSEFPADAPPSRVEVVLEPAGDGTHVTIRQSDIPPGQGEQYQSGWVEHYLTPMAKYFSTPTISPPATGLAKVAKQVKTAVKTAATNVAKKPTKKLRAAAKGAVKKVKKAARKAVRKAAKRVEKAAKSVKKATKKAGKKAKSKK